MVFERSKRAYPRSTKAANKFGLNQLLHKKISPKRFLRMSLDSYSSLSDTESYLDWTKKVAKDILYFTHVQLLYWEFDRILQKNILRENIFDERFFWRKVFLRENIFDERFWQNWNAEEEVVVSRLVIDRRPYFQHHFFLWRHLRSFSSLDFH